jgi:hypothetical protein
VTDRVAIAASVAAADDVANRADMPDSLVSAPPAAGTAWDDRRVAERTHGGSEPHLRAGSLRTHHRHLRACSIAGRGHGCERHPGEAEPAILVLLAAFALAACGGESKQDEAKAQVARRHPSRTLERS